MALIDVRAGRIKTIATFFQATELIGEGRFSEVYKAYNQKSKTDVALKIYLGVDESTGAIAKAEVELLQKLEQFKMDFFPQPKGGLRTFKVDNRNHPFIAMELCEFIDQEGATRRIISLKDIIPTEEADPDPWLSEAGFWEPESVAHFILGLCDAVRMLHKHDIIHRDLKPSNILLKKIPSERLTKPFFLDFNTSSRMGTQVCVGGTQAYLPPEVLSKQRKEADPADDLWAISKTIAEFIFGSGCEIKASSKPHELIAFDLPDEVIEIILKALSPMPSDRYQNAEELYKAFEHSLTKLRQADNDHDLDGASVSSDEIVWVRENKTRIFEDIIEVLSGENEIPVFKEIRDAVSFVYSSLYQYDTRSFDIREEIVRLSTKAIPALIEESYKLVVDSPEFTAISESLGQLAIKAEGVARKAIDVYCVSSDYNVRKMCQAVCDKIAYFPTKLIDSIIENDTLYLPNERVDIADLCIKWSNDSSVMMSLNMYMCREYILDQRLYYNLKNRIALRAKDLNFEKKVALIVQDTKMRVWEDLPEYEKLSDSCKEQVDSGLVELFGDAFSSLGQEAFEYIRVAELPAKCDSDRLPIARVFLGKLASRHPPARTFLFARLRTSPNTEDWLATRRIRDLSVEEEEVLRSSGRRLGLSFEEEPDIPVKFEHYLNEGQKRDRVVLCKRGSMQTLDLIEDRVAYERDSKKIQRMLSLLDGFQSQHRQKVLQILINSKATG